MKEFIVTWLVATLIYTGVVVVFSIPMIIATSLHSGWWALLYIPLISLALTSLNKWG